MKHLFFYTFGTTLQLLDVAQLWNIIYILQVFYFLFSCSTGNTLFHLLFSSLQFLKQDLYFSHLNFHHTIIQLVSYTSLYRLTFLLKYYKTLYKIPSQLVLLPAFISRLNKSLFYLSRTSIAFELLFLNLSR